MTIYTQQVNTIMEQLPETEQQFILEFVKKIGNSNHLYNPKRTSNKKKPNPKEAIKSFIEIVNSAPDEVLDDEFDEILAKGISLRTPEELDLL